MSFPITIDANVEINGYASKRDIVIHRGLTILLGPNGSGKTQLMRALKRGLRPHALGKKVRLISAGRIGMLERYRSDFDGQRGGSPSFQLAQYGGVTESSRRHEFETIQGDFLTLAARPDILVKIRERLRKLFKRDISIFWDQGNLKIEFSQANGSGRSYSSGSEASGLLHLCGLLSALYDDEVGVLLIDEPEVFLHPQLQAFLLHEMLSVAGFPNPKGNKKILVACTHSTEFLRVEKPLDLTSLVFCTDLRLRPVQISPTAGELQSSKIAELISRMGQEHKLAFFARYPLLVEGPSDAIICSSLCSKLDIHIEAGGSQILPVIGKGQFSVVVKLLRLCGKEPRVLSDADGFTDSLELVNCFTQNDAANTKATEFGFRSAAELARIVHRDFSQLVDSNWSDIAELAQRVRYWTECGSSETPEGLLKAKRRTAFVLLHQLSDESILELSNGMLWSAMKRRINSLQLLLQSQGCFILKRGTIEDYYSYAALTSESNKPSMAAEETAGIQVSDVDQVRLRYQDIVSCLEFAASTEKIAEEESLRDLVLAVAAPALARLRSGSRTDDLNMMAKSALGIQAELLDLRADQQNLIIDLKSEILDVSGFPICIGLDEDVLTAVSRALRLA